MGRAPMLHPGSILYPALPLIDADHRGALVNLAAWIGFGGHDCLIVRQGGNKVEDGFGKVQNDDSLFHTCNGNLTFSRVK